MVLPPLTENVTELTITPFLQLELAPKGEETWDLITNNNWIRVENAIESLSGELAVTRQNVDAITVGLDDEIDAINSRVDNEAIERSAADAALQAQIPPNIAVCARFSGRSMTAGATEFFTHNLGKFPIVAVKREVGSGTVDVSNAFDTVVNDNNPNQISVSVGETGTYTIVCVA